MKIELVDLELGLLTEWDVGDGVEVVDFPVGCCNCAEVWSG